MRGTPRAYFHDIVGFTNRIHVSKRGSQIPKKLENDAIVEAIFELRFKTTTQQEFLVVRLADHVPWKSFNRARLPAYGIPENIRQIDQNFTYQPIFELTEPSLQRSIRIGPNVLSYHLRAPYVGWDKFLPELQGATQALFWCADDLTVTRLGLRYVNALVPGLHSINGISDLDLSLMVAGMPLTAKVNLNFFIPGGDLYDGAVRIATREFVTPQMPNNASVIADIDIFTKTIFEAKDEKLILEWLETAHRIEKQEFFSLLTDETIAQLKET